MKAIKALNLKPKTAYQTFVTESAMPSLGSCTNIIHAAQSLGKAKPIFGEDVKQQSLFEYILFLRVVYLRIVQTQRNPVHPQNDPVLAMQMLLQGAHQTTVWHVRSSCFGACDDCGSMLLFCWCRYMRNNSPFCNSERPESNWLVSG